MCAVTFVFALCLCKTRVAHPVEKKSSKEEKKERKKGRERPKKKKRRKKVGSVHFFVLYLILLCEFLCVQDQVSSPV